MAKHNGHAVLPLVFVAACILSSACGNNMGPECSDLKEIQVHYKNYFDIYLGNDYDNNLDENGVFVKVTKTAVNLCCSTAKVTFHWLQSQDKDVEEYMLDAVKADSNNPNRSVIKLFTPEYAYKKMQYVYDSQRPFLGLFRSPGPALVMKRQPPKEPVFLGDIFLKSYSIILALITSAWIVGILVWALDHHYNSKDFPNPFYVGMMEGFWWSIVTMTTVGYGDKTPKGRVARIMAVMWIMTSTIFLSLFTANISSIMAISQAEEDVTNTIGKTIGCINSHRFFSAELNVGARWLGFDNMDSVSVAIKSGEIDRLVFPDYLDWLILTGKPGYERFNKDFTLSNSLNHPFQIGLACAVEPRNMTTVEETFIRCMRKELPVLAKRIRRETIGEISEASLQEAKKQEKEKMPLDNDSLFTLIYSCLGFIGCLMPLGVFWDCSRYWKNRRLHDEGKEQTEDVEMAEVSNLGMAMDDEDQSAIKGTMDPELDREDVASNQSGSAPIEFFDV